MRLKSLLPVGVLGLALAGVIIGRNIWLKTPPYERGVHNLEIQAQIDHGRADGPRVGNCPVFPADNVWNTRIDSLPKQSDSDMIMSSIGLTTKLHPDFGSNLNIGIPFTEIRPDTKRVHVTFLYRGESDLSNYPIPPDAPIEGGAANVGDRHVLLIDTGRCLLYELYGAEKIDDNNWSAKQGSKFDLTSNALRQINWTSADAAGLPIFPGLIRYSEVQAGEINHALRFTVPHTRSSFIWPARHKASHLDDPDLPPMGLRLRLRADVDISKFPRNDQVILRALKRYGMFLADNGGGIFITGVPDKRWDDSELHKLSSITAADFEVVDESSLQMITDSARVDPYAVKH